VAKSWSKEDLDFLRGFLGSRCGGISREDIESIAKHTGRSLSAVSNMLYKLRCGMVVNTGSLNPNTTDTKTSLSEDIVKALFLVKELNILLSRIRPEIDTLESWVCDTVKIKKKYEKFTVDFSSGGIVELK